MKKALYVVAKSFSLENSYNIMQSKPTEKSLCKLLFEEQQQQSFKLSMNALSNQPTQI